MTAHTSHASPPRRQFALTGRTRVLDPRTHAIRGDLADVRLAEHVFAPHYAAPMPRVALTDVRVRGDRHADADAIGALSAGMVFEVLDVAGGSAWGIAPADRTVGYVDVAALGDPA